MTDIDYMQRAYQLALKGKGRTFPNPMVGAVLVKNKRVVGQGWHQRCGGPHAEVMAIRRAGKKAQGARLFVTLEPCHHFGRTPPCVDLIIRNGIREVVIGMKDPNPLVEGRSVARLRRTGVKTRILTGRSPRVQDLKKKLEIMNAPFQKVVRRHLPFVVAKAAQTLDGKIATARGESKWITAKATRDYARHLRNDFDAICVGVQTVLKDNPRLNASRKTKRLKKIVLDTSLRISPRARLFQHTRPQDCYIATTKKAPPRRIKQFEKKGVQMIVCPATARGVSLPWLFRELAKREISYILLEGGAKVIGSALKAQLVDQMRIFIAPLVFGDQQAKSAVDGLPASRIRQAVRLKNVNLCRVGSDWFVQGDVHYVHRHR